MKKVGFIGFGNMAEAIITGMIASGNFNCGEIGAFDTDENKLSSGAARLGITAFKDNTELVSQCECVVVAVKPIALQNVLVPLRKVFCKANPLVISIAAGKSIEYLGNLLGYDARLIRVMPNINAIAGQAVSGYSHSENIFDDDVLMCEKILESFGTAISVEEDKFSVYSAIAGCSPAYVYLFTDTIARVGVKYGLSKKDALNIVCDAVSNYKSGMTNKDISDVIYNAIESAYKKDKGM